MKSLTIKRIIALLFAVIMVLSVVACTNDPDNPKETEKPTEAVTDPDGSQDPEDTLETYVPNRTDYEEGTTISFLFPDQATLNKYSICNDIWVESMNGDVLADAVWKRNEVLRTTTGITVSFTMHHYNKMLTPIQQDQSSGDYTYEVFGPSFNNVPTFFNNQLLANINTIGLDLSYSWFDKNCTDLFSIKGKQLAIASNITFIDKVTCPAVFFNKTLVEDNQFGDLYQMVIDKTWTWDEMLRMAEVVSSGFENDNEYTMDDFYGISAQSDFCYYMLHSTGLTSVVKNERGDFVYNGTNETLIDCLEDIYTLMANKNLFLDRLNTTGKQEIPAILDHFAAGMSLFLVRPVESVFGLRDKTEDYGIIPMPIYYEGQEEYYSTTNTPTASVTCFPSYLPKDRYEKVNDAIQVLAMESTKLVMPALYEKCLGTRLQDKNMPAMLDIIFLNKVYDFGYIFNFANIRSVIVVGQGDAERSAQFISTTLASLDRSVGQELTKFMLQAEAYDN